MSLTPNRKTPPPIPYKIVKIIDDTTVIINAPGTETHLNQHFQIYSETLPIEDLDGTLLGDLILSKGDVYVIETYPKFSILRTKLVNPFDVKVYEHLECVSQPLKFDTTVSIGDNVIETIDGNHIILRKRVIL